jgi:hypothetical protein
MRREKPPQKEHHQQKTSETKGSFAITASESHVSQRQQPTTNHHGDEDR